MGVQILSHNLFNKLNKNEKLKEILKIVKSGDLVLIEGSLTPEFELELTNKTLEKINEKFSGIEFANLNNKDEKTKNIFKIVKNKLINILLKDRIGLTIIGPSKIIKSIKSNPEKLEVLFKEKIKKKK